MSPARMMRTIAAFRGSDWNEESKPGGENYRPLKQELR